MSRPARGGIGQGVAKFARKIPAVVLRQAGLEKTRGFPDVFEAGQDGHALFQEPARTPPVPRLFPD
jgi:hypothetical protein